jgi:putative flippase GtrA
MYKLRDLIEQFIKFGLVGLSNTFISLAIYYIFIFINKDLYLVGNIIGFVVSVLNSYYWNNRFVFKAENRNHVQALLRTFLSYGVTFVLGTVLLIIMIEILSISEIVAPLINLIITVPINFMLNKFWAFKDR